MTHDLTTPRARAGTPTRALLAGEAVAGPLLITELVTDALDRDTDARRTRNHDG
jgi:hypothetical protein